MFKFSKISPENETLAQKLKRARRAKKIRLPDVAKKLNINLKYLQALEKGKYDNIPTGVYGKNFLKEYAWLLGLDCNKLIDLYQSEKENLSPADDQIIFSNQIIKKHQLWTIPKIIKNSLIVLIILICFGYLGFLLKQVLSPPELFLYSPEENLITDSQTVSVIGKTEPEVYLTINEELVLVDTEGNFSKIVNLKKGVNIIQIICSKKYGRNEAVTRHILFE